jgi:hypothetical protein
VQGDQLLAAGDDVSGLVAEKAGPLDGFLQFFLVGSGKRSRIGILGKKGRGDLIDHHVGTLSRQNGGDEELKRILVIQGTVGIGIQLG